MTEHLLTKTRLGMISIETAVFIVSGKIFQILGPRFLRVSNPYCQVFAGMFSVLLLLPTNMLDIKLGADPFITYTLYMSQKYTYVCMCTITSTSMSDSTRDLQVLLYRMSQPSPIFILKFPSLVFQKYNNDMFR